MWKSKARRQRDYQERLFADDAPGMLAVATESARRHPDDAGVLADLAVALASNGRFREAEEAAVKAGTHPKADPPSRLRSAAQLIKRNRPDDVARILALIGDTPLTFPCDAEFDHLRGLLASARGQDEDAERWLSSAVATDPTSAFYLSDLTEFHAGRGNEKAARMAIERLDSVEPRATLQRTLWALGLIAERGPGAEGDLPADDLDESKPFDLDVACNLGVDANIGATSKPPRLPTVAPMISGTASRRPISACSSNGAATWRKPRRPSAAPTHAAPDRAPSPWLVCCTIAATRLAPTTPWRAPKPGDSRWPTLMPPTTGRRSRPLSPCGRGARARGPSRSRPRGEPRCCRARARSA